jgi:NAD(P)-dependent dehydrogenase (short-subunit alcohol dehydrogenase family)
MKIKGSVVLVTGANRGLGKALVEKLLAAGAARVYATARNPAQLEAVVARDRARVVPLRLDTTNPEDVAAVAKSAHDVNLLVNNAGVLSSANVLTTPRARIDADFATNVFGMLEVTKALLPAIERAGHGAIVNVLTVVSLSSMPGLGGYCASKAAAYSVTQALRGELASKGIAVHAVFPGPVDTDMSREITLPKTSADVVAQAIVDGIERGDEDILPDPMAQQVFGKWSQNPKEIERMFGAM